MVAEIKRQYNERKNDILAMFEYANYKVSITSDIWTAGKYGIGYSCVTAHYIDENWILPDRTVDRPVPSRGGPAPGGQRWDGFGFFEFGPTKTGPCRPCGTVDRGPCRTVDRPDLDRTGPDRTVFNTLGACSMSNLNN
jgi:hypothetical protein